MRSCTRILELAEGTGLRCEFGGQVQVSSEIARVRTALRKVNIHRNHSATKIGALEDVQKRRSPDRLLLVEGSDENLDFSGSRVVGVLSVKLVENVASLVRTSLPNEPTWGLWHPCDSDEEDGGSNELKSNWDLPGQNRVFRRKRVDDGGGDDDSDNLNSLRGGEQKPRSTHWSWDRLLSTLKTDLVQVDDGTAPLGRS